MAPGTRRANRSGYAEHDDFEGLPVRQWRQDWVNLTPPAPQEQAQQNDIWAIELIHGMPKDSHLLAPHSQELLRAARSGRLYKRPAPPEDDEVDIDAGQAAEKAEKKEEDHPGQGFSIKLWKQIHRNSEGSGPAYLAKRRKGTVTIASKTVDEKTTPGSTVTRATVRKTDAAGNPYTEEVTLADGQQVVGEIISTRVEAVQTAAADGFAAPAPALRRRPPPPKRKSKAGPGRGKKKVRTELSGQGLAAGMAQAAGEVVSVSAYGPGAHGMPHEVIGTSNRASENAEVDDDEEDDDDDDDEDGEGGEDEGEDDEEGDQQMNDADESKVHDIEMTDVPEEQRPVTPGNNLVVDLDAADGMTTQIGTTSSNPFTLAPAIGGLATHSPRNEGSPLKNVRFQSKSQSQSPAPTDPQEAPAVSTEPAKGAPNSAAAAEAIPVDAVMSEAPAAEIRTESMIAEPPSMAAGDEGITRIDEDVVMTETVLDEAPMGESQSDVQQYSETRPEVDRFSPDMDPRGDALLPPPPEQVGNITSPRSYEGPERTSDCEEKDEEGHAHESHMHDDRTAALNAYDSIITEDTIQPEDSASIRFPLTESGAPSEGGAALAEETKSSAAAETPRQTSLSRPTSPTADTDMEAAAATDPTGDRPITLEHDEPNASQESRKDSSGVAPVSPEAPSAVQSTQSPAALQHMSNDASREPTPVQAVQSEEQASPLDDAIQDNSLSLVDDPLPPQQSDEVATQEESTLDQAVETGPVPETSQIEDELAASSTGEDAKIDPKEQREEVAEFHMDEDAKINPQEQSEEPTTSSTGENAKIYQEDQREEPATSSTSEDAKINQEEQRDEPVQEQEQGLRQDPPNERVGSPKEESKSQSQALSLEPEPEPSSEVVSGPATTEPTDPEASTTDDTVAAAARSSPPILPPTSASPPASTADGAGESNPGAADGPAEATIAAEAAAVVDGKTEDAPAGV
ncbi:hypothetical protein E4U59_006237 [Claviceps monticola]|nr:hypothetical protein E4U59_006237 [Claviceps monticola]